MDISHEILERYTNSKLIKIKQKVESSKKKSKVGRQKKQKVIIKQIQKISP